MYLFIRLLLGLWRRNPIEERMRKNTTNLLSPMMMRNKHSAKLIVEFLAKMQTPLSETQRTKFQQIYQALQLLNCYYMYLLVIRPLSMLQSSASHRTATWRNSGLSSKILSSQRTSVRNRISGAAPSCWRGNPRMEKKKACSWAHRWPYLGRSTPDLSLGDAWDVEAFTAGSRASSAIANK